jgi:hypothetical protein
MGMLNTKADVASIRWMSAINVIVLKIHIVNAFFLKYYSPVAGSAN